MFKSKQNRSEEVNSFSPLMLAALVNLYEGNSEATQYVRMFDPKGGRMTFHIAVAEAYKNAVWANYVRCQREVEMAVADQHYETGENWSTERAIWFSYFVNLREHISRKTPPIIPMEVIDGVEIFNICDFDPKMELSDDETTAAVDAFQRTFDAVYYGVPKEDFSMNAAAKFARMNGKNRVVVEDLS